MANPEHLQLLLKGSRVWNFWRAKEPEISPDLMDVDLRGRDLSKFDLLNVNFARALLNDADLSNANLTRTYFGWANLRGANLSGSRLHNNRWENAKLAEANLQRVDLGEAKMSFADLAGADLTGANLVRTNLSGVDLSGAKMVKTYLFETDLRGACLKNVDLRHSFMGGVLIEGGDLTNTNWGQVRLANTHFQSTDLSAVSGLETVIHYGPSIIGVETLFLSQGQIPEKFLLGCGVSQEVISACTSLTSPLIKHRPCFLHYRVEDEKVANQVHRELERRGICCWRNEDYITEDNDYLDVYGPISKQWHKIVLLASRNSLDAPATHWLMRLAQEREARLAKTNEQLEPMMLVIDMDGFLSVGWGNDKADWAKSRIVADFTRCGVGSQEGQDQIKNIAEALRR